MIVDVKQNEELLFSLQKLKTAREELEEQKYIKKMLEDQLAENPHYAAALEKIGELLEEMNDLTEEVKTKAVELYNLNPEAGKKLAGGNVTIKESTNAQIIDAKLALEWAEKNAPAMLILDTKALLKHAKAVSDTLPLDFVEITKELTAAIASDIKFG